MTLTDAIATQATWIQTWVMWLVLVEIAVPLLLVFFPPSRKTGFIILGVNLAMIASMMLAHSQFGLTRILGAVHITYWVPLLFWLFSQTRANWPALALGMLWMFIITIGISLAFDVADTIRYLLGDRGSLVPVS